MMKQIQKNNSITDKNNSNVQNTNLEQTVINEKNIPNDNQKPTIQDRVKLIYIDDEYAGLPQGICGTVTGISSIKEVFRRDNRPESIVWVEWDNGIKLGLIDGVDKYEIISDTQRYKHKQIIFHDNKESRVL